MIGTVKFKHVVYLQSVVLVYTLSGITAKYASQTPFLSGKFMLFYGFELCLLGLYSVLWQQILKRFNLSFAFSNRSSALIWSMIWSFVIFQEAISVFNVIGVVFIIAGMLIINTDSKTDE